MKNRSGTSLASASMLFAVALVLASTSAGCKALSPRSEPSDSYALGKKEVATMAATLDETAYVMGLDFFQYRHVAGLGFSPDGTFLAVAPSASGAVQIWDWHKNKIAHSLDRIQGGEMRLTSEPIKYSPDGKLLAVCHSQAGGSIVARIWNTGVWQVVQDIYDPIAMGGCNAVGFSPDSKQLFRALDRPPTFPPDNLFVYDTATWKPSWVLQSAFFHSYSMAINPGGNLLALGGEIIDGGAIRRQIAIVDLARRVIRRTIPDTVTDHVSRLAWSPDGAYIASADEEGVEIFDANTGSLVANEKNDGRQVLLRYTPDGRYLIESGFGKGGETVRIWDGQHRQLLQEINAAPNSLAVSGDGHYLAMDAGRTIQIWEFR